MYDLLREEFPGFLAYLRRLPNPRIAPAPLFWSVLAAFGASYFVWAAVIVLFTLLYGLLGLSGNAPVPRPFEFASSARTGSALAVAYVAGGRDALAVYAALRGADLLANALTQFRFCGLIVSSLPGCSLPIFVISLWPALLGVALGYGLLRWLPPAVPEESGLASANPTMEVAGALSLVQTVLGVASAFLLRSTTSFEAGVLSLAAPVLAGLASGLVLLRRVPEGRRWRTLAVLSIAVVGSWVFVSLPAFMRTGTFSADQVSGLAAATFFAPFFELGAAALVLYRSAARRIDVSA